MNFKLTREISISQDRKFFKCSFITNNNMNPGDPNGSPDESFFLINYLDSRRFYQWKM